MAEISAPELRLLEESLFGEDARRAKPGSRDSLPSDAGIQGTARALGEELRTKSKMFSDKYTPNEGLQEVPDPLLNAIYDFLSNQGGPTRR
jgi:hypothetical protein